jgi:hypothetical protein
MALSFYLSVEQNRTYLLLGWNQLCVLSCGLTQGDVTRQNQWINLSNFLKSYFLTLLSAPGFYLSFSPRKLEDMYLLFVGTVRLFFGCSLQIINSPVLFVIYDIPQKCLMNLARQDVVTPTTFQLRPSFVTDTWRATWRWRYTKFSFRERGRL